MNRTVPRTASTATRASLAACVAIGIAASAPATAAGHAPWLDWTVGADVTLKLAGATMGSPRAAAPRAAPAQLLSVSTIQVTSCADDGGFDTLRHAVLVANTGDTVDMSTLACAKVTLKSGAISVGVDDLTIKGPGAQKLAIDGAQTDRVFNHLKSGTLTLDNVTVMNGKFTGDQAFGGCIYSKGSVSMTGSVVTACAAVGQSFAGGGAIVVLHDLNLSQTTLSGNATTAQVGTDNSLSATGGAFFAVEHALLLGSVVSGNTVQAATGKAMGGAGAASYLTMKYSTISGNTATASGDVPNGNYSIAGGTASSADTHVVGSTIDHNEADTDGAMWIQDGTATASITQSTISSNSGLLGVGALDVDADISIYNSTIAFNTSGSVAPVAILFNKAATLQSTIVADNDAYDLTAGTVSGANNLVKNAVDGVILPGDTKTLDPKLGPLALNGGTTRTHAIAADSPARDAGADPGKFPRDQRGGSYARIVGAKPDIGAYELDPDHVFGNGCETH